MTSWSLNTVVGRTTESRRFYPSMRISTTGIPALGAVCAVSAFVSTNLHGGVYFGLACQAAHRDWPRPVCMGQNILGRQRAESCTPEMPFRPKSCPADSSLTHILVVCIDDGEFTAKEQSRNKFRLSQPKASVLKLRYSRLREINGVETQGIIITRSVSEGSGGRTI